MKKILFINNYDMKRARELYLKDESPSQHQFGTSELIDTNEFEVDYMLAAPKNNKIKIFKLLSLIPIWLDIYKKAKKYDYVYGAADFTVDFLGLLKKIRLFKPHLIAIFHHPPFDLRLKFEKYDKVIFLSKYSFKEMNQKFPKRQHEFEFMQWGPDLNFYINNISTINCNIINKDLIFISNGKTKRDHELFLSAAESSQNKIVIVSDEYNIPNNYNSKCKYTEIYNQNSPNDINMIHLLNKCSVLVIPTPKTNKRLGPIGLTSFLDAVALGIPIISADNTAFANIIVDKKLGFIYNAGDQVDLENKMNLFKKNPLLINELGFNACEFGRKYDIKYFGDKLYNIFKSID